MPKIVFEGRNAVAHECIMANVTAARARGLPRVPCLPAHARRLAVVGGGASTLDRLHEIYEYDEVWALNGATCWLKGNGIDAVFLSVDPLPIIAQWAKCATRAIICTRCAPETFEALRNADVSVFDAIQDEPSGIWASISTVLSVPHLAVEYGFRDVTFYGCEGSFMPDGNTHVYMNDPQDFRFTVECGGWEYLTLPELYLTTEQLATFLRTFPSHYKERSGGLLRAMVANGEHDITRISLPLLKSIAPDRAKAYEVAA